MKNTNLLTMPEIKEMMSIVLHDLGFSTAVVHQVCLCLQSPSIYHIKSPFSFPAIVSQLIQLIGSISQDGDSFCYCMQLHSNVAVIISSFLILLFSWNYGIITFTNSPNGLCSKSAVQSTCGTSLVCL